MLVLCRRRFACEILLASGRRSTHTSCESAWGPPAVASMPLARPGLCGSGRHVPLHLAFCSSEVCMASSQTFGEPARRPTSRSRVHRRSLAALLRAFQRSSLSSLGRPFSVAYVLPRGACVYKAASMG